MRPGLFLFGEDEHDDFGVLAVAGDLQQAAELRYGILPDLQTQLLDQQEALEKLGMHGMVEHLEN